MACPDVPANDPAGKIMTLADLRPGQQGRIFRLPDSSVGTTLAVLGMVRGAVVALGRRAPLGDPRTYSLYGAQLSLRDAEARQVAIQLC